MIAAVPRLALIFLSLTVGAPALAADWSPGLDGKDKFKVRGLAKGSSRAPMTLLVGDDASFRFEAPGESWTGVAEGAGRKRTLRLDVESVGRMAQSMAEALRVEIEGPPEDPEIVRRRLLLELERAESELKRITGEGRALAGRLVALKLKKSITGGSGPELEELRKRLAVNEAELEKARKLVARIATAVELGAPERPRVLVRISNISLRAKYNRRSTKVQVKGAIEFLLINESTGEVYKGIRKVKARGGAFEIVD